MQRKTEEMALRNEQGTHYVPSALNADDLCDIRERDQFSVENRNRKSLQIPILVARLLKIVWR